MFCKCYYCNSEAQLIRIIDSRVTYYIHCKGQGNKPCTPLPHTKLHKTKQDAKLEWNLINIIREYA